MYYEETQPGIPHDASLVIGSSERGGMRCCRELDTIARLDHDDYVIRVRRTPREGRSTIGRPYAIIAWKMTLSAKMNDLKYCRDDRTIFENHFISRNRGLAPDRYKSFLGYGGIEPRMSPEKFKDFYSNRREYGPLYLRGMSVIVEPLHYRGSKTVFFREVDAFVYWTQHPLYDYYSGDIMEYSRRFFGGDACERPELERQIERL